MRTIDADALLERVRDEEIQAQAHGREFSTCFMSPGGTPSTEWWYVEDLIENAPSVTPKQRVGEWVLSKDTKGWTFGKCSSCGFMQYAGAFKFCPNCGAKMEG